ncbi:MAG: hypothetical protein EOP00_23860 [Pedobacter sp.]|nr:MAG: hypothetical protein EOP00_23860 [Pedobacter sp.]
MITICFAQQASIVNPFSKLNFSKAYKDTTIVASYTGISDDIGTANKTITEAIAKHTGEKIKGLKYSIGLKIGSYPSLSVACNDNSMVDVLKNNSGKSTQIRIVCKVYRFYTFDGICNFFYINKVSLI